MKIFKNLKKRLQFIAINSVFSRILQTVGKRMLIAVLGAVLILGGCKKPPVVDVDKDELRRQLEQGFLADCDCGLQKGMQDKINAELKVFDSVFYRGTEEGADERTYTRLNAQSTAQEWIDTGVTFDSIEKIFKKENIRNGGRSLGGWGGQAYPEHPLGYPPEDGPECDVKRAKLGAAYNLIVGRKARDFLNNTYPEENYIVTQRQDVEGCNGYIGPVGQPDGSYKYYKETSVDIDNFSKLKCNQAQYQNYLKNCPECQKKLAEVDAMK